MNPNTRPRSQDGKMLAVSAEERFWQKVTPVGECLIWLGGLEQAGGYGRIEVDGRPMPAHRYAYELLVGPIPPGLEIDHLCRNPACVAPLHLEPVTHRENLLRGMTITRASALKTHCIRGHAFAGDNLFIRPNGDRVCRACGRVRGASKRLRAAGRACKGGSGE